MPSVYAADLWCDACADKICDNISKFCPERVPADLENESSWESDVFPKRVKDLGAMDYPKHCSSDSNCVMPLRLSDGRIEGALLNNELTDAGVDYVRECMRESPNDPLVRFWREMYTEAGYDLGSSQPELTSPQVYSFLQRLWYQLDELESAADDLRDKLNCIRTQVGEAMKNTNVELEE